MGDLLYKDISMAISILLNLLRVLEDDQERLYDFCDRYFDEQEFKRLMHTVLKGLTAQANTNPRTGPSTRLRVTAKTLPAIALSGVMHHHSKTASFTLRSYYDIFNPDGIRLLLSFNCTQLGRGLALFLSRDYLGDAMRTYYELPQQEALDVDRYLTQKFFVTNGMLALVQDRLIYCMVKWTNFKHTSGPSYSIDKVPQQEHVSVHDIVSQALYHLRRLSNVSHYLSRYPVQASTEMIDYLSIKDDEMKHYEKMHLFVGNNRGNVSIGAFEMLAARIIDDSKAMRELESSLARIDRPRSRIQK